MGGLRKLRRTQDVAIRKKLAAMGPLSEALQALGQRLFPEIDTLAMDAAEAEQHLKFLAALWNMVVLARLQPEDLPAFLAEMAAQTGTDIEILHATLEDGLAVHLDEFPQDTRRVMDVVVRVDETAGLHVKVVGALAV